MARQVQNAALDPSSMIPGRSQSPRLEDPRDHGSSAAGAWRDKSEAPPSAPGSMIPGSSQSLRLKDSRDHGSTAGGAWQNKSENPSHADQALRLVVEWTAHL